MAPPTPGGTAASDGEYPEEKLAFALGDGRVGVLAVCGRKVLLQFTTFTLFSTLIPRP